MKKDCTFTKGYACACAVVAYNEGPEAGLAVMREGGFTEDDFLDAQVEPTDLERLGIVEGVKQKKVVKRCVCGRCAPARGGRCLKCRKAKAARVSK